MLKNKLLSASGAAEAALAIEDVFSTYLYTGNGSTQTITNGIDLAGEGGMVWTKARSSSFNHALNDTVRGINKRLSSNTSGAEVTNSDTITSVTGSGYVLGADNSSLLFNYSGATYASWTFRKAPRFFDVVTYTGDGTTNRQINHNLNTDVGCVTVKSLNFASSWMVKHRSNIGQGTLNSTSPFTAFAAPDVKSASSTSFTVSDSANLSGGQYVAYLFAHDPLGPSGDGSDGLIACGSVTGFGTTVDIGWEPQWLLIKRSDGIGDWILADNMRGIATGGNDALLYANTSGAETSANDWVDLTSTGFVNKIGSGTYIYIAIRRGPMRPPESGSEVFAVDTKAVNTAVYNTGFPVDMLWNARRDGSVDNFPFVDRLRGTTSTAARWLVSSSNVAEKTGSGFGWATDSNTTWTSNGVWSENPQVGYAFRRAPEFFDVVAYTGDGTTEQTFSHSLGVVPEMVIIKNRSRASTYWPVRFSDAITTNMGKLNSSDAFGFNVIGTLTDTTVQTLYTNQFVTNYLGDNYIAYLFASKAGVSKVGSYTGNGTSQTINCGFTTGARFILIKRTDSTGDWYVWDTARGIVAANDPHLSLNTTAAEVTTNDSIDPASSGFIVNQIAATNINVSSASYIFMAIS